MSMTVPDFQSLQGQRARKRGVLTASSFLREAKDYARSLQTTIVLNDGVKLAYYMIDNLALASTMSRPSH